MSFLDPLPGINEMINVNPGALSTFHRRPDCGILNDFQTGQFSGGPGCKSVQCMKKKKHAGSDNTTYINKGKGDALAQRAVSLPHQRVRVKLVGSGGLLKARGPRAPELK
eukprot:1155104-Pelagomonas_calceolata.AAC.3